MMQFDIPKENPSIIKVIGVGGGGSNAVNHMFGLGIKGVEFIVCNTDQQALENSPVPKKISLGPSITEGRGAGALPEVGKNAAVETLDELKDILRENTKMVFVTAGMGGGTGTGAAPIIAGVAKEMGILTVGIVTIPFSFEGKKRKSTAEKGIEELRQNVDTLLVICNDKLRQIHGNLKLTEAFSHADNILSVAAKSIAEIITTDLHLNVDFADVQTVMKESGVAIMGAASATGEERALTAATTALDSPLLNDNHIVGARFILLNITSGDIEATMDEVGEINDYIQEQAGNSADIIMGIGHDDSLGDGLNVTVIATGFQTKDQLDNVIEKEDEKVMFNINGDRLNGQSSEPIEQKVDEPTNETPVENPEIDQKVVESGIKLITKDESTANDTLKMADNDPIDTTEEPESIPDPQIIHYLTDDVDTGDVTSETVQETDEIVEAPINTNVETNSSEVELTDDEPKVFEFSVDSNSESTPSEDKEEEVGEKYDPLPPVVRNEEELTEESVEDPDDFMNSQLEKTRDRIQKLRELSYNYKMRNSENISQFEKEPAYKRRNVELKNVPDASNEEVSRYSLSSDKEERPEIKPDNPYLHDRVD
jgi:cell division protein FtsZ